MKNVDISESDLKIIRNAISKIRQKVLILNDYKVPGCEYPLEHIADHLMMLNHFMTMLCDYKCIKKPEINPIEFHLIHYNTDIEEYSNRVDKIMKNIKSVKK